MSRSGPSGSAGPGTSGTERGVAIVLNRLVPAMIRQALWRRGFFEPALVTHWDAVVGPELAGRTAPMRIVFPNRERSGGVLHVRVDGAFAVELQHMAPQVVERLNAFCGYAALARLALHQGPVGSAAALDGAAR